MAIVTFVVGAYHMVSHTLKRAIYMSTLVIPQANTKRFFTLLAGINGNENDIHVFVTSGDHRNVLEIRHSASWYRGTQRGPKLYGTQDRAT